MSFIPYDANEVRRESECLGNVDGKEAHALTIKPPSGTEEDAVYIILGVKCRKATPDEALRFRPL